MTRHTPSGPCAPTSLHPQTAHGWDPRTYPVFTAEFDNYEELQAAVVAAARGRNVKTILDLGCGTGETASRLLSLHNSSTFVGVDANKAMLDAAAKSLPPERTTLHQGWIEEFIPPVPFDLIVSVLALHDLDGREKVALFAKVSDSLAAGGRFVLGDIMAKHHHKPTVARLRLSLHEKGAFGTGRAIAIRLWRKLRPDRHEAASSRGHDQPDLLIDQIAWLTEAGLTVNVAWERGSLAVITADKPHDPGRAPYREICS